MYKLKIHHDLDIQKSTQDGTMDKLYKPVMSDYGFPGHSYIELVEEGKTAKIIGFNLETEGMITQYKDETVRLDRAKKYQEQHPNEKVLHTKEIILTKEQYTRAQEELKKYESFVITNPEAKNIPGSEKVGGKYNLLNNNCVHFSNKIYQATGLLGSYTHQYTSCDIQTIAGAVMSVVGRTLMKDAFHPGDKPIEVIEGNITIEEVAKKYNVPTYMVSKKALTTGIHEIHGMLEDNHRIEKMTFIIAANPALAKEDSADLFNKSFDITDQKEEEKVSEESKNKEKERAAKQEEVMKRLFKFMAKQRAEELIKQLQDNVQRLLNDFSIKNKKELKEYEQKIGNDAKSKILAFKAKLRSEYIQKICDQKIIDEIRVVMQAKLAADFAKKFAAVEASLKPGESVFVNNNVEANQEKARLDKFFKVMRDADLEKLQKYGKSVLDDLQKTSEKQAIISNVEVEKANKNCAEYMQKNVENIFQELEKENPNIDALIANLNDSLQILGKEIGVNKVLLISKENREMFEGGEEESDVLYNNIDNKNYNIKNSSFETSVENLPQVDIKLDSSILGNLFDV